MSWQDIAAFAVEGRIPGYFAAKNPALAAVAREAAGGGQRRASMVGFAGGGGGGSAGGGSGAGDIHTQPHFPSMQAFEEAINGAFLKLPGVLLGKQGGGKP